MSRINYIATAVFWFGNGFITGMAAIIGARSDLTATDKNWLMACGAITALGTFLALGIRSDDLKERKAKK